MGSNKEAMEDLRCILKVVIPQVPRIIWVLLEPMEGTRVMAIILATACLANMEDMVVTQRNMRSKVPMVRAVHSSRVPVAKQVVL
jgi:hypothetical protein